MAATKKQGEIKGFERPVIQEIEDAAEEYRDERNKRMKMTKKEVTLKKALQIVLHKHEKELVDKDANGNPAYFLEDGEDMAVLMRSEEDAKVMKAPKPKIKKDKPAA